MLSDQLHFYQQLSVNKVKVSSLLHEIDNALVLYCFRAFNAHNLVCRVRDHLNNFLNNMLVCYNEFVMPVVTDYQEVPNTPAALTKPMHITATAEYKGNRFPEHGSLAWKAL